MSKRCRATGPIALVLFAATAPAHGQSPTAALTARVLDERGLPLIRAAVWVDDRSVLTDTTGTAIIDDILPGIHFVRARADGYQAESVMLEFAAGATADFEARLAQLPDVIPLDLISVVAERRSRTLVMAGFYTRKDSFNGSFLERDELAQQQHLPEVALLFRNIRGFQARWLCEHGFSCRYVIRSTRGRTGLRGGGCTPQLIGDGILWHGDQLTSLSVADLEAVEAYPGPASTPPQFILSASGTSCGTVLFWTRHAR